MTNQDLVQHIYGYRAKFGWVQKRIAEHASFVWLNEEKTLFRDATFAEAAAMRIEQAKQPRGLVYFVEGKGGKLLTRCYFSELPGLIFKPAQNAQALTRQGYALLKQANQFCQAHA